jgi:UDP:flavonoid glycosyltransferase YjiC (YdhE family)
MLIVPFGMDQPDNAERMRRLGVARVLSRKRFSAQSAVRELEALLGQARYQFASASLAKQIAAEDGAAVACDHLERRLETSPKNTFQSNDYRLAINVA